MITPKKTLKILYISQYFPPEIGATQTRAYEMTQNLASMGHEITVLTEFPNHPTGIIPKQYRYRFFKKEKMGLVNVLRLWVYANPKKTFMTRMLFYLTFMCNVILIGIFLQNKFDIIYATSPPLFVSVSGYVLALLKSTRFVFEVRDLWPQSAIVLGELNNRYLIKLARKVEFFLYKRADKIVAVTRGIYKNLIQRKIPPKKIELIINGANTDLYFPAAKDSKIRGNWKVKPSTFVIGYTGLHGLIHGLDCVIEAARLLQHEQDIFFVFIGDGVKKQNIIDLAHEYNLQNVLFMKAQPEDKLPRYIQSCDVGLATTKKIDLCKGTLPVKMFTYMACAKPVLLCVDGEARELLKESEAGLYVEPENAAALAQAILKLKSDPYLCQMMGNKGRKFVEKNYSRKQLAKKLESFLL